MTSRILELLGNPYVLFVIAVAGVLMGARLLVAAYTDKLAEEPRRRLLGAVGVVLTGVSVALLAVAFQQMQLLVGD
jgi:hypothetical protein